MATVSSPLNKLNKVPPKSKAPYIWADFIELLCLANPDRQVSQADVIDRVRGAIDDNVQGIIENINPAQALEDPNLTDLLAGTKESGYLLEERGIDEEETESPAERDDKWEQWAGERFSQLEYRTGAFTDFYPFSLSEDKRVLTRHENLTLKHKIYVFFLLASNLHYFNKKDGTTLTSVFEVASYHALENCLPQNSQRFMFGKHPLNTGPYSGKLWNKLGKLAEDIKEVVRCKKENFSPLDSGDAGLDLVAWVPWADSTSGNLLVFAQCGCGADWPPKQAETSMEVWDNYMSFTAYPSRMTFIPHCFRAANGEWHNPDEIHKTVVVDRPRLTFLLREKEMVLRDYIEELVDSALNYTEPVI